MKRWKAACVLTSGGADSAILLEEALRRHKNVYPVFVRCGLSWEKAELHWLKKYLKAVRRPGLNRLTITSVPVGALYDRHWSLTGKNVPGYRSPDRDVYLPGRNILLLSEAAVFCAVRRIPIILSGVLKGNPFPDGQPRFFRAAEKMLRQGLSYPISIKTPFADLPKKTVLNRGRTLPLHLTFSCLRPRGVLACGRCNKCAERDQAFQAMGIRSR